MKKGLFVLAVIGLAAPFGGISAAPADVSEEITFTRHIAPILQRSCENCHRSDGVAPMSLQTYEEVRPWARAIKQRTGIGPKMGVMPPWYVEKNIGIQKYKNDPSLSAEEIAMVAKWADNGAPRGNPADMPPAKHYADASAWSIGKPDLVISTKQLTVKANAPDWWGEIESVPLGLTEDRYVSALEVKEVNDVDTKGGSGRQTVGGRYVFHHMIWSTRVEGANEPDPLTGVADGVTSWPVHEVGRNADFFDEQGARLLKAGSSLVSDSVHLHSNGRDTKAHLEIGFKFQPKGYEPTVRRSSRGLGNGLDIDIKGMEAGQQLHAYTVLQEHTKITTFEPHLHAPGARMCLEAIWGINVQTLTCAGYDHNWVRGYDYADDVAPILPKGTILHIIGYMDNSPSNKNVPDPRNWQGSGNRSVANMFIDLGQQVTLSEEQFQAEMAKRREQMKLTQSDVVIGCPLCNVAPKPAPVKLEPTTLGIQNSEFRILNSEGRLPKRGPALYICAVMIEPTGARRPRVLVVEDEEPIRDLVCFHLDLAGFDCVTAIDGKEALRIATAEEFDLVVLDLLLPLVDGVTICRAVRQDGPNRDVPIMMLTARREEADKVLGLESGADDYLTKPFGIREFLARTSALMRRPRSTWRSSQSASSPAGARVISLLGVTIDPARRRVVCDGKVVSLTPQEFSLLYVLASHPGIVFTREDLLARVWQQEVFVTDRGVDTLVKRLRRKIERDAAQPERVITVWGAGYKFGE